MSPRPWILAVDFGTSNTVAAHTGPVSGDVEVLPLTHTGNSMPSAVFVDAGQRLLVGAEARTRADTDPTAYLPEPKRLLDRDVLDVAGHRVPASAPVAAVLAAVHHRALAAHDGRPPARLVLTHPEAWPPRQIDLLTQAAAQACPDVPVSTLSEPRAAAAYYTRAEQLAPGTHIAVFDFGGGTLDIAVLAARAGGRFEVVAARGDNALGGRSFDSAIRRWVDEQLDDNHPDVLEWLRTRAPMQTHLALDASVRDAKETLSETTTATIVVPTETGRTQLLLTRDEFDHVISDQVDAAVRLCAATLTDAGITGPAGLHALYLTGGSSRVPLVHSRLGRFAPVATLDDPKTVVARGAVHAQQPAATRPLGAITRPLSTTTPAGGRRSGGRVAAAAAAVTALAAGGYALSTGGTKTPDAGGDTTAGQQPAPVAGIAAAPADPLQAAVGGEVAKLQPPLRDAVTNCRTIDSSPVTKVQCAVRTDAEPFTGLTTGEYSTLIFSVNRDNARISLASLKRRINQDYAVPVNEIVEGHQGTAAAHIAGPKTGSETFAIHYVNSTTGLELDYSDAKTLDAAKTLLSQAGLL